MPKFFLKAVKFSSFFNFKGREFQILGIKTSKFIFDLAILWKVHFILCVLLDMAPICDFSITVSVFVFNIILCHWSRIYFLVIVSIIKYGFRSFYVNRKIYFYHIILNFELNFVKLIYDEIERSTSKYVIGFF